MSPRILNTVVAVAGGIAIVIMIAAWLILLNDTTMQSKDYVILLQVTVVFFTAIGTATISLVSINIPKNNSLVISSSTEQLKARLGQLVPKKYESYHSMWKAATDYFLALKKLELGEYPESQLKEAENERNLAFGESLLASLKMWKNMLHLCKRYFL